MLETLFELLFKVRPVAWDDGTFGFEAARPVLILVLVAGLAAALATVYWKRRPGTGAQRVRSLLGLRLFVLGLLAFALLRPVLKVSMVVPGENFLAVLIDDSRSMQLAARGADLSRGERALATFDGESSPLVQRLKERFTLRTYSFSETARRAASTGPLEFKGRTTDLGAALARVRQDLAGVPLAGAVLVTDGADRLTAGNLGETESASVDTGGRLSEELLQMASRGIPVYTVGLGEERFERDLELRRLQAPERVLEGSSFAVDVTVAQQGYDGETVQLQVEREGAIVAAQEVVFDGGQASEVAVRVHLEAEETGPATYRFEVSAGEEEQVLENNAREILLAVEDRRDKILYFEGEPRFEVRFLRQAVAEDEHLQLVVLLRTAENKLLRLGVDDPLELVSGFPATREELFAYRGLVLGSVEASYFTRNQLAIIEEFVSERGGGLLLLGGRSSFAEGGYQGTPLGDLSPLVLSSSRDDFFAEVGVRATEAGQAHAALQLADDGQTQPSWQDLPPLSVRNPLSEAKPGASVLLTGTPAAGSEADGSELVVLASQRYGRGRVAAFPVQDSWIWQMHHSIPLEDMTHERLWRQLLRWLTSTTPLQVELEASTRQPAPGERVSLRASVRDRAYLGVNGARVEATIVDPIGAEHQVPLEWTVEDDGEYQATFVAELEGSYDVRVTAEVDGEPIGEDRARWVAADRPTEFFEAEMNAPLLRRVAEATGGHFYTARDVDSLADDARYTASGKTSLETIELWDMPIILLLLLGAISAEWLLRRRWGLL